MSTLLLFLLFQAIITFSAPNVAIIYYTETNHTLLLAQAIQAGVESAGASTRLLTVIEANFSQDVLSWADALVLGSPTHFGNVAAPVLNWVDKDWRNFWNDPRCPGKLAAVFATGGGLAQGIEPVLMSLARLLWSFRFEVLQPPPQANGFVSYGAIAIVNTPPFDQPGIAEPFKTDAERLGRFVVSKILK